MKKNLFYYLFAVLCTVTLFTSCSDDDEPTVSMSEAVAGEYEGKLDVALVIGGASVSTGDPLTQSVSVTRAGDTMVDLRITGFSFQGMNLGNIELENCQLTDAGNGAYRFTATTELNLMNLLSGSVAATGEFTSKDELFLDLDIDEVVLAGNAVNYTVKVGYEGTKVAQ